MAQINSVLLSLQGPTGLPRSSLLRSVTDPINPSPRTSERLRHFHDGIYDLSPESHLSRLLKVVLGDVGVGVLSKQYSVARQSSMLLTTHYGDLDKLYGALLGLRRLSGETLDINPYFESATPERWAEIDARDAAYRSRIEAFCRALLLGATPDGMAALGQAILGVDCRIYETYLFVDETGGNPGGSAPAAGGRTYGKVQEDFVYYSEMQRGTYADIEGGHGSWGRTTTQNRTEFIVVPKRPITLEENYELTRVLGRFKPTHSLLTINPSGVEIHSPVKLRQVYADSTYWEVASKVAPKKEVVGAYTDVYADASPQVQSRPAFSGYQGEAWSYNDDIASVVSYTQDASGAVRSRYNYERIMAGKVEVDFSPNKAVADPSALLMGRAVSDGIMTVSPYASRLQGASQ